MTYEYEHEHRNMKAGVFSGLATNESVEELQEVYRKAKAFDEIREIEIQSDITGYHDNTESYMYEVESVIEKYEEDE